MPALRKPIAILTLALVAGLAACGEPEASEVMEVTDEVVLDGVPTFEGDANWPTLPPRLRLGVR